jgi:hypothetical protein
MWIERLDASHALAYRELMLEAYDRHPQAFTSSVRERAVMPLSWWEAPDQQAGCGARRVRGGRTGRHRRAGLRASKARHK